MIMVLGPHHKKAEAKVELRAEKESRAAERAADGGRGAGRAHAPPTAGRRRRRSAGRSENLDPEIEA